MRAVLLALCDREGGHDIALDIFTTRLFDAESDKRELTEEERTLGAELLAMTTFDERRRDEGRELGRIAKSCLIAPRDTATVAGLCDRLLEAFANYNAYPWDYSDLIASLGHQFPTVVLDKFVQKAETGNGTRDFFAQSREFKPDPLRTIPDNVCSTWAKEGPESRFPLLARAIRSWRMEDEPADALVEEGQIAKKPVWTPLAVALVREAPDDRVPSCGVTAVM